MYINEKMKLNRFREVSIPRNRDYFARYGFANSPATQYTGEEDAPHMMTKIQQIEDYQNYCKSEIAKKEE